MIPVSTKICAGVYAIALGVQLLGAHLPKERVDVPPPAPKVAAPPPEAVRRSGRIFNSPSIRLSGWPLGTYQAFVRAEGPLVHTRLTLTFEKISKKLPYGKLELGVPAGAWVDEFSCEQNKVVTQPKVVLASSPLPAFVKHSSRTDIVLPQVLEVTVPCDPAKGTVRIMVGYLERFRPDEQYWLPMSAVGEKFPVTIVRHWPPGPPVTISPVMDFTGDLQFTRAGASAELRGERWAVRSDPPGHAATTGQTGKESGSCYWSQVEGRRDAALLVPDEWAGWAQVNPAVYAGKAAPSPAEQKLIVSNRILCPYSRFVFPGLEPGGLKRVELVPERVQR